MPESSPETVSVEPDDRFPSGPWTGFFLQPVLPGRHWMELTLTFRDGQIQGEGRDLVGSFRIVGQYTVVNGKCQWAKTYPGKHTLAYRGYNEGRGIWGVWEQVPGWNGGFRIWPVGMSDPTLERQSESVDAPSATPVDWVLEPVAAVEIGEPVGTEVGFPIGRSVTGLNR